MKKFLVFVMICVVALGIGFTTFRFTVKQQVVKIDTTPIECNQGDTFTIDINVKNKKGGTVITATSADKNVVDVSKTAGDEYKFEALRGGKTQIVVTSNISGFKQQTIDVTVGDGSSETMPLYISTVEQYNRIGNDDIYKLNKCYKLISDLNFDGNYQVRGDFSGKFDFNNHRLSDVGVEANELTTVGLFTSIANEGIVKNLVLSDFTSRGNAKNGTVTIGAIAGVNNGTIRDVSITKVTIEDASNDGVFGGVAGQNNGTIKRVFAKLVKINTESETSTVGANSIVGGLVGLNKGANANVTACLSNPIIAGGAYVGGAVGINNSAVVEDCQIGGFAENCVLTATNDGAYVGGLVGYNKCESARASIADAYALLNVGQKGKRGAIVAKNENAIVSGVNVENPIFGCYYNQDLTGAGVPAILERGDYAAASKFTEFVYEKTEAELKSAKEVYVSYLDGDQNVYWQIGIVWNFETGSVATLNTGVNSGVSRIASFVSANGDPGKINRDTAGSSLDPNTDYRITEDIVITSPIPAYNAVLEGIKKPNGEYPTVTFNYNTFEGDWAALIGELGRNGHLKNLNFVITIANIDSTEVCYYADLVAHNYGEVSNCNVLNTSLLGVTKVPAKAIYVGGIAAENRGQIIDTNHLGTISVNATSSVESYVGGIAGKSFEDSNITNVYNGTKSGAKAISVNKTFVGYVGGICGLTSANIANAINYEAVAVMMNSGDGSTALGGVVGKAEGTNIKISRSGNIANLTAKNIGGVVGITSGGSSSIDIMFEECMSRGTLKGLRVGGIVYVGSCGLFKNCLSENRLDGSTGEEDNSILAGLVYKMNVTSSGIVRAYNCVSNCTFGSAGYKYYEDANQIVMGQGNVASILRGGYHPDPIRAYGCVDVWALSNCYAINHGDASVVRTNGMTYKDNEWVARDAANATINAKADHLIDLTDGEAIQTMKTARTEELLINREGFTLVWFFETGTNTRQLEVSNYEDSIWSISAGSIALNAFSGK